MCRLTRLILLADPNSSSHLDIPKYDIMDKFHNGRWIIYFHLRNSAGSGLNISFTGREKVQSDLGSNPGPLAYRASALSTELPDTLSPQW